MRCKFLVLILANSSKLRFTWKLKIKGQEEEIRVDYSKVSGWRRFFHNGKPFHQHKQKKGDSAYTADELLDGVEFEFFNAAKETDYHLKINGHPYKSYPLIDYGSQTSRQRAPNPLSPRMSKLYTQY